MGTPGVITDKSKIINAIHDKKGIIEYAAASIPCAPKTIYDWMKRDPEIAEAVKEARANAAQELLDKNEILKSKAYKSAEYLLDKKETTMTIFTLKTLAGFKEQAVDQTITLNHIEKPYRGEDNNHSS